MKHVILNSWAENGTLSIINQTQIRYPIIAFCIFKISSFCLWSANSLIEPKHPFLFSLTTDQHHSPGFIN